MSLNMSLGKKAKPKYPSKKTMNLLIREGGANSPSRALAGLLVVVIVVAVFAKFAVIDRLAAVNDQRDELSSYQAQLVQMNTYLEGFAETREEFMRYSSGYLSDEERVLQDRLDLLDMLNENMAGLANLVSVSIIDNTMLISLTASQLSDIADLRSRFELSPGVTSVTIYTVDTTEDADNQVETVSASIVVEVGPAEEAGQ